MENSEVCVQSIQKEPPLVKKMGLEAQRTLDASSLNFQMGKESSGISLERYLQNKQFNKNFIDILIYPVLLKS